MIANILIGAGILWVFLGALSFMQSVQLRSIYNMLSGKGRIVSGQDRRLLGAQYCLFAAVSKDGVVADARILKAVRFITPPKILEYPRLIGSDLNNFEPDALDADPRIQLAAAALKRSWEKLKPTLNRTIPSLYRKDESKPRGGEAREYREETETAPDNQYLRRGEREIRELLSDGELSINREPLEMVLDALLACDHALVFGTDEVIADKTFQLRTVLRAGKGIDIPRADGLVETVFRLITQREGEARFRRGA
ncbi:MAG: transcriptional regulator GutM [Treponema sp.]|jgi:hypothetical protein|nr:transcriptional regulator GutM [Treponema sp.]